MSTSVTLNTDGPCDPLYVLEVAEALAEAARVLNHLTRGHECLEYPSEADRLIREVSVAAGRLPQLLGQVTRWLSDEQAAARIEMPGGEYAGRPDLAFTAARLRLDAAAGLAGELQEMLDAAASVTCDMADVDDDSGEGSGNA
jgi:hypothetical protein